MQVGVVLRLVVALLALVGLAIQVFGTGRSLAQLAHYYTNQSNGIVMLVLLGGAMRAAGVGVRWEWVGVVERSAYLWVYVTGIVFHWLLSAYWRPGGLEGVANVLLHYAVPIGVLVCWLAGHEKGHYRLAEVGVWASYPLAYLGFTLTSGYLSGSYPYWFLTPGKVDIAGLGPTLSLALVCAGLLGMFLLLGVVVTVVDGWLARRGRRA